MWTCFPCIQLFDKKKSFGGAVKSEVITNQELEEELQTQLLGNSKNEKYTHLSKISGADLVNI